MRFEGKQQGIPIEQGVENRAENPGMKQKDLKGS